MRQSAHGRFVALAGAGGMADPRAVLGDERAGVFLDFFFWEQTASARPRPGVTI